MGRWTCPECGRSFGRARQGHECAPALDLEEYFATGPERERPIFEAVWAHLADLADAEGQEVHVEPVSVGIFFKGRTTFAQLRPKTRWVALGFSLGRELRSPRLSRRTIPHGDRFHHTVNLVEAADVDDEIGGWLTEAFEDDVDRA